MSSNPTDKSTKSLLDWDEESQDVDQEFEKDFQSAAEVPKACSIDSPDCESCQ